MLIAPASMRLTYRRWWSSISRPKRGKSRARDARLGQGGHERAVTAGERQAQPHGKLKVGRIVGAQIEAPREVRQRIKSHQFTVADQVQIRKVRERLRRIPGFQPAAPLKPH